MNTIDLRLLSVFDEIYKSRSVSAAADALDLGQPAVSVALSKLRHHFSDQLFVRIAGSMEPTPFAEELAGPIRAALEAVDVVLGQRSSFDPATAERTFRICMADISQLVLLPDLLKKLRLTAPGLRINVLPVTNNTAHLLETGETDLALGVMPQLESGFYQQVLFRQSFVCMVSLHHPRITDALSREHYEAEDHAAVVASGAAPLIVSQEIARQGIARRVVLEIPNFLGAAFVVEHTDLLLTIPSRLADVLKGRGDFRTFPVPFVLPEYEVKQLWHQRYHNDPGNRWLRRVIADLLSESGPITSTG